MSGSSLPKPYRVRVGLKNRVTSSVNSPEAVYSIYFQDRTLPVFVLDGMSGGFNPLNKQIVPPATGIPDGYDMDGDGEAFIAAKTVLRTTAAGGVRMPLGMRVDCDLTYNVPLGSAGLPAGSVYVVAISSNSASGTFSNIAGRTYQYASYNPTTGALEGGFIPINSSAIGTSGQINGQTMSVQFATTPGGDDESGTCNFPLQFNIAIQAWCENAYYGGQTPGTYNGPATPTFTLSATVSGGPVECQNCISNSGDIVIEIGAGLAQSGGTITGQSGYAGIIPITAPSSSSTPTGAYITGTVTVTPICSACDFEITPKVNICTGATEPPPPPPCKPICFTMGETGSWTAPADGMLYPVYNDTFMPDNIVPGYDRFTGTVNGSDGSTVACTILGNNSLPVGISVSAGVTYTWSFTGEIDNGVGYRTGPDGDGSVGKCLACQCPPASYGSLAGKFVCAASLSNGIPPTCGFPAGTIGASSEVLTTPVWMAVSDGTTLTTFQTSTGSISLPGSGGPNAANDGSFGVVDVPDFGSADGITTGGGYVTVQAIACPNGQYIWAITPFVGGGDNPTNLRAPATLAGSFSAPFFNDATTGLYDTPLTAASVWANGSTSGSVKWCIYFPTPVIS